MKKVFLFEPSIGSDNAGDQVIVDGIKKAFEPYLQSSQVIELPTHTPMYNRYIRYLGNADLKLICGSNLLVGNLFSLVHLRQWALSRRTLNCLSGGILVGVGAQQYGQKITLGTRCAYKKILDKSVMHSVRDNYTLNQLKEIGITNVINTGCPSMWQLTDEHCATIPIEKAPMVVLTLTDYKKKPKRDSLLLETLKKSYEKVFFWPQGAGDLQYFLELGERQDVEILPPSLVSYTSFLNNHNVDYVGTRLHGGMRALQCARRSVIIGVDNRAKELKTDFNVPVLEEEKIDAISEIINSNWKTSIHIPTDNIEIFMRQFENMGAFTF